MRGFRILKDELMLLDFGAVREEVFFEQKFAFNI
jgi:hypothetical protein